MKILKLSDIHNEGLKKSYLEQVKTIFFLSTSIKEFSTPEKKETFFKRWCGDYITLYPEEFFIMVEDEKVLGYLSGCIDSIKARSELNVPAFDAFADLFLEYPAHLHINFHPDCRGRGLGSVLVNEFCKELRGLNSPGVHLVTSPKAVNVTFYQRLGFKHEVERSFNQMQLLFMGKKLE